MNLKRWLILMIKGSNKGKSLRTEVDVNYILKVFDRNIFTWKLLELKKDSRGSSDNVRVISEKISRKTVIQPYIQS